MQSEALTLCKQEWDSKTCLLRLQQLAGNTEDKVSATNMFYMLFMHHWTHYERTFMVMTGLSPVTYLSIRVVPDSNLY